MLGKFYILTRDKPPILGAGGDFADGVIAYEGNWLSGETFVSFDKKAVMLLTAQGQSAGHL